jgi:hypothetical protein
VIGEHRPAAGRTGHGPVVPGEIAASRRREGQHQVGARAYRVPREPGGLPRGRRPGAGDDRDTRRHGAPHRLDQGDALRSGQGGSLTGGAAHEHRLHSARHQVTGQLPGRAGIDLAVVAKDGHQRDPDAAEHLGRGSRPVPACATLDGGWFVHARVLHVLRIRPSAALLPIVSAAAPAAGAAGGVPAGRAGCGSR